MQSRSVHCQTRLREKWKYSAGDQVSLELFLCLGMAERDPGLFLSLLDFSGRFVALGAFFGLTGKV